MAVGSSIEEGDDTLIHFVLMFNHRHFGNEGLQEVSNLKLADVMSEGRSKQGSQSIQVTLQRLSIGKEEPREGNSRL